jgi:hypothetical protein
LEGLGSERVRSEPWLSKISTAPVGGQFRGATSTSNHARAAGGLSGVRALEGWVGASSERAVVLQDLGDSRWRSFPGATNASNRARRRGWVVRRSGLGGLGLGASRGSPRSGRAPVGGRFPERQIPLTAHVGAGCAVRRSKSWRVGVRSEAWLSKIATTRAVATGSWRYAWRSQAMVSDRVWRLGGCSRLDLPGGIRRYRASIGFWARSCPCLRAILGAAPKAVDLADRVTSEGLKSRRLIDRTRVRRAMGRLCGATQAPDELGPAAGVGPPEPGVQELERPFRSGLDPMAASGRASREQRCGSKPSCGDARPSDRAPRSGWHRTNGMLGANALSMRDRVPRVEWITLNLATDVPGGRTDQGST